MRTKGLQNGSIVAGMATGIIAGLVASWTMDEFQRLMSKAEKAWANSSSNPSAEQGQQLSSEEPATVKAAEAFSRNVLGRELADAEKAPAGEIAHYAMGAVSGAAYGMLAHTVPLATWGRGVLFGTVLWLNADEGIVPAAGFSKPPWDYPLSTHLSALSGHLVYAITLDLLARGLQCLV